MAKQFEVKMSGSAIVEAEDEIAAEDLAMDLIHGDIATWASTSADIEFNVDGVEEVS